MSTAAGPSVSVRRRRATEAKRERLMEAAALLFARQGFAKTSVEEVASAASVSKGLVYVHFESKEALLAAVLERAVAGWTAATRDGAAAGAPSPAGVIAGGVRASVDYLTENPILMEALSQDLEPALLTGGLMAKRDLVGRYIDTTRIAVEHGVSTGEFRRGIDAAVVAEVIWLIHDGLVRQLTRSKRARSRAEIDQLVESAVDLFTAGLLAQPRQA